MEKEKCNGCPLKDAYEQLKGLHDCNDCSYKYGCDYMPKYGQIVRINCPLWRGGE